MVLGAVVDSGGGTSPKFQWGGPARNEKMDPRFCKNEGLKRSNKKGVNKIENQGENWYKLLQRCQMTDFCEKID